MYSILKEEGKRAFLSWRFILCTVAIGILWYANSRRFAYNQDVLTIFFNSVGRSTVTYVGIAVCNCTYGLSICEDLQGGIIKEIIARTSIKSYVLSKGIIYMLASMLTYILGNTLYLGYEITKHPLVLKNSLIIENLKELTVFHTLVPDHALLFILLQIVMSAVCCSCVGIITLALSPYLQDGFLILGTPVVIFFLLMFVTEFAGNGYWNFESIFWSITAETSATAFFMKVFGITVTIEMVSGITLYKGVQRYIYG